MPLGPVAENAGESIHRKFNKFIENKQVASPESPYFGPNLRKVIVAINSHAAVAFERFL